MNRTATKKTKKTKAKKKRRPEEEIPAETIVVSHLVVGWWWMAIFIAAGMVLEAFHGFKIGWYLNVGNETRRMMVMMCHCSGTIMGVLHVLFAVVARHCPSWSAKERAFASMNLLAASVFIPGGFLLAGIFQRDGSPGMGILLVAAGAILVLISAGWTAVACRRLGVFGAAK